MGKLRTFTRRAFMVGSVAVAGGVAFGTYQVVRPAKAPPAPDDAIALNPWVIIDQSGVTVIVPRAEMGQGVQTTLAALVAEELEMPLADLHIAHGPPSESYANTILLSPREYDSERPGKLVGSVLQAMPKILKLQITGGSTSTADAFDKMRHAGAAARETLLLAAADRLDIGIDQVRAEAGHVVATDGTRIPYTELAETAASLTAPKAPRLKPRKDWTLLGNSQRRLDHLAKATGTARYAIDVRLPDMRFATVRMSPRLGATMDAMDATAAEQMQGVEAVVDLGDGFAVIASNTWLAMQAADAVEVTWGAAPYPASTEAIFDQIAKAFDDKPNITARDEGDVEAAANGTLVEAEYRAPYLAHATMEPMNATALYTGDALELWAGNQAPIMMRDDVAKAVGLSKDAVTVHTLIMGGGFGRRSQTDFGVLAARVAKAMPNVPVQVTWSREEDTTHDFFRPGAIARMAARVDGDSVTMMTGDLASASVMAAQSPVPMADPMITEAVGNQPYDIENIRVRGYAAQVDIPVGFWRSVGASQNGFFHESFIDELALAAGADPVAFRLKMMRPADPRAAAVLAKATEMAGWSGQTPDGVGRGVAMTYSFGTRVAEVIEVVDDDGAIRVSNVWIAADLGLVLDPENVKAQMIGGCIYGLSAAIHGEITFADGMAEQTNFPDYEALRMQNTPNFEVALIEGGDNIGGAGEPGTPPAAPALANALFDLTGKRMRSMPFMHDFDFVS